MLGGITIKNQPYMHQHCLLHSKHIQSKWWYAAIITCHHINKRYTDNVGDIPYAIYQYLYEYIHMV